MEKLVKQILSRPPYPRSWTWSKNWLLKIVSLCFAIFLWYFVVGEDKVDLTVFIPIEIVNLPRDLVISNQFKKQLEVTVSGPRGLIRGISSQQITRPVDLSKATPGTMVVRNDADSIPFPRGVKVLRTQPTHIIFLLDRLIQKDLPIKPIIEGTPPEGYEVASIQLEPATISLTGPQAVLGGEDALTTNPIDVSGLTGPIMKQVALSLQPAVADLIGEPVVTARINVREKSVERKVANIPVAITHSGPPIHYTIQPPGVDVKAELPVGLAKDTKDLKDLFIANVGLNGLPPGRHQLPVNLTASKEVRVLEVSPQTVTVEISPPKSR